MNNNPFFPEWIRRLFLIEEQAWIQEFEATHPLIRVLDVALRTGAILWILLWFVLNNGRDAILTIRDRLFPDILEEQEEEMMELLEMEEEEGGSRMDEDDEYDDDDDISFESID